MTDRNRYLHRATLWSRWLRIGARRLFAWSTHWMTVAGEEVVSLRGMALICMAWISFLTACGWIAPPLSPKLSALHIPLRFALGGGQPAQDLLYNPRHIGIFSLGAALLVLYGLGIVTVYRRPQWLPGVAGVLFSVVLAANAMVAFNHPEFIELVRMESAQQKRVATMMQTEYPATLTDPHRISLGDEGFAYTAGHVSFPSVAYLEYGVWTLFFLALAVILSSQRALLGRFGLLGGYTVAGLLLSSIVCAPQIWGQWFWLRAQRAEVRGKTSFARTLLASASKESVSYEVIRPAMLFRGRLDFEEGRQSRTRDWLEAVQWQAIHEPGRAEVLLDGLYVPGGDPAMNRETAALLTLVGLDYSKKGWSGAALNRWQDALVMNRWRLENRFFCGFVDARWQSPLPDFCLSTVEPLLLWTADRPLRADFLSFKGDVLFAAGDLTLSRQAYLKSMILFNLPKTINYRAQKGLGGM